MHLLNSTTVLMVSLLLHGRSTLCGSYILLYVQVHALVTGYRTVIFVLSMVRNCKNLATLAYSTGVILLRSIHYSVIDVSHLLGRDSITALQSSHGLPPKCFDDQLPACKARMPQQWVGTLEALVSM